MKKIRCALYDRVSTDMQVKDGLSLDAQRDALTGYAISHGYEIVGCYTDEGITARKNMHSRRELSRLLKDVEAGRIDLILVTKLDRWFRNIRDYHNTQAILEAHNCNWKTIFEQYDTSTSNGRFAINIIVCYLIAFSVAQPLMEKVLAAQPRVIVDNVAMFLGMCMFIVMNFFGQKIFVFRKIRHGRA